MTCVWKLELLLFAPFLIEAHCVSDSCIGTAKYDQLSTKLVQIQEENVQLIPVGRNYLSLDAEATANFFVQLFNAEMIETNMSLGTCSRAVSLKWAGIIVRFFEFEGGDMVRTYIQGAQDQWMMMAHGGEIGYSRWLDNHDGFNVADEKYFNYDGFIGADFLIQLADVYTRVQIPETYWNMEFSGAMSVSLNLPYTINPNRTLGPAPADLLCRVPFAANLEDEQPFSDEFWWKSTFASLDPEAAAEFAQDYLMATRTTSEYPNVAGNCTLSAWMVLPNSMFQLHFVRTEPCDDVEPTVGAWVEQQEKIRDLTGGNIDQFMMSNLVLWTESLDPFVERLIAGSQPFTLYENTPGVFDLFVNVPNNEIVFNLRSSYLTVAKPLGSMNVCR